jgi:hypothetical protein
MLNLRSIYRRLPIVSDLKSVVRTLMQIADQQAAQRLLHQQQYAASLLAQSRYDHPGRLNRFEFQVFSQNGEDGILHEIFDRVGVTTRSFVEIGVGERENNSAFLLLQGWRGSWIDSDAQTITAINRHYRKPISQGRLKTACAKVTADNVQSILTDLGVSREIDLLSIDVDRNTYWIWEALQEPVARVVVVEYNATLAPWIDWKVDYEALRGWNGTSYFGASLKAYEILGRRLGYRLVGCDLHGVNAFFVRDDVCVGKFAGPHDAEFHYEPPRYFLIHTPGHPRAFTD